MHDIRLKNLHASHLHSKFTWRLDIEWIVTNKKVNSSVHVFLVITHRWSLGQCNIFTHVCLFFWGVSVHDVTCCVWYHVILLPMRSLSRGEVSVWGVPLWGGGILSGIENISLFCGAIDTPIMDFCWHLSLGFKARVDSSLPYFVLINVLEALSGLDPWEIN